MAAAVGSARVTKAKKIQLLPGWETIKRKVAHSGRGGMSFPVGSREERQSHFFLKKCPDLPGGADSSPGALFTDSGFDRKCST